MVAATVRSLAHLRSLKLYEPVATDPDAKDSVDTSATEFVGVQEQRVSGLMIHTLIGGSILFCRNLLRGIPISVLTGLFLYLGMSSITTTDMYQRALLFFTDHRDVPSNNTWAKKVSLTRTKLFTALQLVLLGSMWWLKNTPLGVFFPVLVGALAPIRMLLQKFNIFTHHELEALDGEIA